MQKTVFGIVIAAILTAIAGYLGYQQTPHPSRDLSSPPIKELKINAVTPQPQRERPAVIEIDDTPPPLEVLTYKSQYIDETALNPTACLRFSHALDADKQPQYNDFIDISPKTQVAVTVKVKTLCLSGFDFSADYNVTIKSGLPASQAEPLLSDKSITLNFGARPPFVGFAGNGIILPRKDAQGLAFETVNVDELDVAIYKVNDRMLVRRDPSEGQLTAEGDYGWAYENAAVNIRSEVWSGEIAVNSIPNQRVTTVLPLRDLVGDLEDGAYVVDIQRSDAGKTLQRPARAWRWVIVTDLALTSYRSDHGLTIFARSLQTAERQGGVELHLLAQNNAVLAKANADKTGRAEFPASILAGTGPDSPQMVLAYGPQGDFAMIDLRRSPLDLSDYDITGREKSSPIDGYGFADRGIYRPGETSNLTFMLRRGDIKAAAPRAAMLKVKRPDNVTVLTRRISADEFKAGTYVASYDVPKDAPRGSWRASLLPDGQDQSVTIKFDVQDFVPQKLRVGFKPYAGVYDGGEALTLPLQADFLYGAPAADLPADGEARLEIDPKPFPAFKDYRFAPRDPEFTDGFHYLSGGATDGSGAVDLVLEALPQVKDSSLPLRLQITGGVAELSGRYVRDSLFIPARSQKHYAGIKSDYKSHRVPKNEAAEFQIVLVNAQGEAQSGTLEWELIEQDWDYQWYKEGSRWRYRRDLREQTLERGPLVLRQDEPSIWSKRLDWGDYRLALKDGSRELNSYQFSIGWGRKTKTDKPDALQITPPDDGVQAGDGFTLTVTAPYAGEADLILTNDETFISKPISLSEGVSEIDLNYDGAWGAGIYALISLYTPRSADQLPIPRRAVGTTYIRRDAAPTTLKLSFDGPDKIRPRRQHLVKLKALQKGQSPKGRLWVNLAAVDEGILQITKFESPSAETYFHAKTSLTASIYDDYGRILNPNLGTAATARSGGDGIGGEGLTVIPQKTVALFKGAVEMKNGEAVIPLDIPDYNGELRLMATAWSQTAVGSASMPLTVRDPVPVELALPRFLAPGDKVEAVISANNIEGAAGDYVFELNSSGGLKLGDDALAFDLPSGQRRDQSLSITAESQMISQLNYKFTGPSHYKITGETSLQTRSPYLPTTQAKRWTIGAGESLTLNADFISNLVPGSVDVTLSVSDGRLIDPAPYIAALRRYPYGCTEQTVSAALPLLYAQDFGEGVQPSLKGYEVKMQNAINKLALRQSENGTFGLWREGDGAASLWLGVYASDFMLRADKAGYDVDKDVLKRTRAALASLNQINANHGLGYRLNVNYYDAQRSAQDRKIDAAAYAGYVMARDGRGRLGQARYIFDSFKGRIQSPLSFGFLSETFARLGDDARAEAAYDMAVEALGYEDTRNYYQTPLRDLAALSAILSNEDHRSRLSLRLSDDIEDANRLRTQELAHVVLALRAQANINSDIRYKADGVQFNEQTSGGALEYASAHVYDHHIHNGVTLHNEGTEPIVLKALASGSPISAPPPVSEGLSVTKTLYDLKGEAVSSDNLRRGERYIVKLKFASQQNRGRTIVVADLLPAGFEIEQILQPADGRQDDKISGPFDWLGEISAFDLTQARDDRFIASGDTRGKASYTAAYIVRAVAKGDFAFPGAVVEDMYRPAERAISPSGRLRISGGGTL